MEDKPPFSEQEDKSSITSLEDKPPFLKKWKNIYWLLMANLAFFILLFYLFTLHFS
jgi:hypothetical protein